MKTWFESLQSREQLLVGAGGVVTALALVWAFAWLPFERGHANMERTVANWNASLNEIKQLRSVANNLAPGGGQVVPVSNQTPVVIIDQTLRSRGLDQSLRRSQPTTSTGIRVEFENVAFDDLVLWLGDISNQYSMNVQACSLAASAQAGPGRINATFTLERTL